VREGEELKECNTICIVSGSFLMTYWLSRYF
jgi:hypothetical protein